jgi:hypothetical protein
VERKLKTIQIALGLGLTLASASAPAFEIPGAIPAGETAALNLAWLEPSGSQPSLHEAVGAAWDPEEFDCPSDLCSFVASVKFLRDTRMASFTPWEYFTGRITRTQYGQQAEAPYLLAQVSADGTMTIYDRFFGGARAASAATLVHLSSHVGAGDSGHVPCARRDGFCDDAFDISGPLSGMSGYRLEAALLKGIRDDSNHNSLEKQIAALDLSHRVFDSFNTVGDDGLQEAD